VIEMVKKQIKCGRCKKLFWTPVKKTYILIAKKKKGKQEMRVVKGAFLKRGKADSECGKLEKHLCPKEYDKVDVEVQLTIAEYFCQRCRNMQSAMENQVKRRESLQKKREKSVVVKEIPDENVAKFMRYQIQQKVIQDYRKTKQEEARTKQREKAEKRLKKIQAEKKKLLEKIKDVETEKPVGENKRKPA